MKMREGRKGGGHVLDMYLMFLYFYETFQLHEKIHFCQRRKRF